jgi:putative oxidoreductase
MKFASWDMHVTLMETHGMMMVPVLLALAGVIQIGASICLLINKQVVICALALAGMVLIINVNLHDFWNIYEGVNAERETQNFVKNLGIFAGLLLLAAMNMEPSSKADTAE